VSERLFVILSDESDEQGRGPCGLSIGPNEDDPADAFAFSETFDSSDGIPEDVSAEFDRIVRAANAHAELLTIAEAVDALDLCEGYSLADSELPKLWDALSLARKAREGGAA
jgi:hypothetical protein